MSGLPSDRNAPFAAWTPELLDQACAEYDARSAELNQARQEAYTEGRKDEREELERIGAVAALAAAHVASVVDPDAALHACTVLEIYLRDQRNPYPVGAVKVIRDYIGRTCGLKGRDE